MASGVSVRFLPENLPSALLLLVRLAADAFASSSSSPPPERPLSGAGPKSDTLRALSRGVGIDDERESAFKWPVALVLLPLPLLLVVLLGLGPFP